MMVGDSISILVGATMSNCGALAMATNHIHGTVADLRPKAVKVVDNGRHCWFPLKALKVLEDDPVMGVRAEAQRWFPLDHWHMRMVSTAVIAG